MATVREREGVTMRGVLCALDDDVDFATLDRDHDQPHIDERRDFWVHALGARRRFS